MAVSEDVPGNPPSTQKYWLQTALRTWRVRTFKNRAQVLRNDKLKKGLEWGLKAAS